jgi:predicted component of type VI protein secretion system
VLWEGQALPLVGALEVGRAPAAGGVRLSDGLAGISRMHCSLRASASGVELVDHSRFGTWLNGRRVAGRASLAAGDRIRVGDPGVELALIAVGADSR